jgi:hypothetical protein
VLVDKEGLVHRQCRKIFIDGRKQQWPRGRGRAGRLGMRCKVWVPSGTGYGWVGLISNAVFDSIRLDTVRPPTSPATLISHH